MTFFVKFDEDVAQPALFTNVMNSGNWGHAPAVMTFRINWTILPLDGWMWLFCSAQKEFEKPEQADMKGVMASHAQFKSIWLLRENLVAIQTNRRVNAVCGD